MTARETKEKNKIISTLLNNALPRLFLFLETGGSGAVERDDTSVPEQ